MRLILPHYILFILIINYLVKKFYIHNYMYISQTFCSKIDCIRSDECSLALLLKLISVCILLYSCIVACEWYREGKCNTIIEHLSVVPFLDIPDTTETKQQHY